MSIQHIEDNDLISSSNEVINDNFDYLESGKMPLSYLDTDTTLSANSDVRVASQKAVKAYVQSGGVSNASETERGLTEEATDSEVTSGASVGATGAKLFVTPAKLATRLNNSVAKFSTTGVFNSTPPSTYTDLDLSAVVGAMQRVVLLQITNVTQSLTGTAIVKTDTAGVVEWIANDSGIVAFRTNGSTVAMSLLAGGPGASGCDLYSGSGMLVDTLTVTVIAYW